MATHELKTWPEFFSAVFDGHKTFELRENDRGYMVGDTLVLREWRPEDGALRGSYTGRTFEASVTYVLYGGRFGLPANVCIMSLGPVQRTPTPH